MKPDGKRMPGQDTADSHDWEQFPTLPFKI